MSETEELLAVTEKGGFTHIIFDMDETLSWLKLPWKEGYETLCQKAPGHLETLMREKWSEKQSYSHIVNPAVEADNSFLPIAVEWAVEFESQLVEHLPNLELVDAIPRLAKDHTLYLWSSNTRKSIEKVLHELGILNYFTRIISREDVTYIKPATDGFKLVDPNVPLGKFLFVGDSYNDRGAAKTIGIEYFEISHFKKLREATTS